VFGSLVKGLRIGLDFLMLLQNEGRIISSLSKVFRLPRLSGNDGLDQFLTQFEAAVDSDFPNYQVLLVSAHTFLCSNHLSLSCELTCFLIVLTGYENLCLIVTEVLPSALMHVL
jgi:hypothetical protein